MNNQGFNTVELLISTAIFTVVMIGFYATFSVGDSIYKRDVIFNQVQEQTNDALARMARELRESQTSTITTINSTEDEITFDTASRSGVRYYLSGGDLYREFSGASTLVAENISELKFQKTGPLLEISIQASKPYQGVTHTFGMAQNVTLRNE